MSDQYEVEWWAYLISKIKEADLSPQNKLKLAQERAVREAQHIVGEIPIKKAWYLITGGNKI